MPNKFYFEEAFGRSLGYLGERELQALRGKRVAIAGVGGVGGSHLLTLARLGVGNFSIADSDTFELANFNRQVGAMTSTLGKNKAEVMAAMAKDINPELDIRIFGNIDESNVDAFLEGADIYLDGIDAFALDAKRLLFSRCAAKKIPAVTAGPLGTGTAYLIFMPGGMTFEEYFALENLSPDERIMHFFAGMAPKYLHKDSLVEPSFINLRSGRGTTTPIACQLASAVASVETMKILLGRGKTYAAPYYQQFDPYAGKFIRGKLNTGKNNPLLRLKKIILKNIVKNIADKARPPMPKPRAKPIERIIEAGMWAPSGDNIQPWRFKIHDDRRFTVEVRRFAHAEPLVLEIRRGLPNVLMAGMLLENIRMAAAAEGMSAAWQVQEANNVLSIDVTLANGETRRDPLLPYIPIRSVNRKHYKPQPLTAEQKIELERSLGDKLAIIWRSGRKENWQSAKLNASATDIRFRMEAAFHQGKEVLDWNNRFSPDKMPVQTLPLAPSSLSMMRWAMQSWNRVRIMNTYFAGTAGPRLEMDLIPGLCSGAHFAIVSRQPLDENDTNTLLAMGGAVQRFWLTLTKLGLAMQPSFAALVFGYHGAHGTAFTEPGLQKKAQKVTADFTRLYKTAIDNTIFMGRIGIPVKVSDSRSLRKPLEDLLM